MNADTGHSDGQPDDRIASLVNEYFDRRQAGEDLTPEAFAAEYPDLSEALTPYLEGLSMLDQLRTATVGLGLPVRAVTAPQQLPEIPGYEVLEETGRGGMGVVYKALQVATKRIVAVKVMLAGPFASPRARRRFEREVELAARLRHPRIVTVLESGQVASGQKYFAMDYVSGVHLDTYIREKKPDLRAVVALLVDVCEAVDYAHSLDVIHRDLKPANVLIDENGTPHVMDFGLAKATNSADMTDSVSAEFSAPGQVMGTLRYLSPEQAAGNHDEVDVRTDVYALGVILYEALTGSLPYDTSGRPSEVVKRIMESPPVRPRSIGSTIDNELSTILFKSLEKEQARRYASAGELAEDLRRYLAGDQILAKKASTFYVLRKSVRRHRAQIAVALAAVALGAAGMWGGVWWSQRQLAVRQAQQLAAARRQVLALQAGIEAGDGAALDEAKSAFARFPGVMEAQLVAARARFELGYPEGARWLLEGELGLDPTLWPYREMLAEIYRHTSGEDEADEAGFDRMAATFEAAVNRQAPNTAQAWYLRTFTTMNTETALERTGQAVRLDPQHELAWERRYYLCRLLQLPSQAIEAAETMTVLTGGAGEWSARCDELRAAQATPTDEADNEAKMEDGLPMPAIGSGSAALDEIVGTTAAPLPPP